MALVDVAMLVVAWGGIAAVMDEQAITASSPLPWVWLVGMLLLLRHRGLYRAREVSIRLLETTALARVAVAGGVGLFVGSFLMGDPALLGAILLSSASFVALRAGRSFFGRWLGGRRRRGQHVRNVMIVGVNDETMELLEVMRDHPDEGYRVVAVVGQDTDLLDLADCSSVQRFESLTAALAEAESLKLTGAIVLAGALGGAQTRAVVQRLLRAGLHVQLSHGLRRVAHHRLRPQTVAHEPLLYVEPASLSGFHQAVKRWALDVPLSLLLLAVTAPILGVAALLIRRDGGPVLFSQKRVGLNGEPFMVFKLRTMVVDAEARRSELVHHNARSGPLFKMTADPRVTGIGRVLRATSIDELPQLVNVLRGEMSLIGPRPALPSEVEQFSTELLARLDVRPGITGLWQVEARDTSSFSAYERLDLFYVENWSLPLDLYILFASAMVVVQRGLHVFAGVFNRSRGAVATPELVLE